MPGVVYQPGDFSRYGGGWVDYTDNDYTAGKPTTIAGGSTYTMARDLEASAANFRLNNPFAGFQFWDNAAKLVRARALNDIIGVRIAMRVVPDRIGGVVRISLATPTIELAGKNMPLTVVPGTEEQLSVDFPQLAVRPSFFQNGAAFMVSSTVTVALVEFSPEFYPLGYEA